MEQLVDRLTLELQDPIHPTFCLCCIYQSFSDAFNNDEMRRASARTLRQDHQDFIASALRYLTTPRTPEGLAILQICLHRSIRRCRRRAVHGDSSPLAGDIILDESFIVLICPVVSCLDAAERMTATQRFSRHGMWPRTVDDILPRGPHDTLATLLFWIARAQRLPFSNTHNYMVQTLQKLICVCRPELTPVLTGDDAVRRAFVDVVCCQLDMAVAALGNPAERGLLLPQVNVLPPLVCIQDIAQFLHYIAVGAGAKFKDWPQIFHGLEHRILQSLEPARMCVSEFAAFRYVADTIASMQIGVYVGLGDPLPEHLKGKLAATHAAMKDPYVRLITELTTIRQRVTCCAHDCGRHPRELNTGKMQRCAACKVYQYCSRQCQKRHWTTQPLPHRTVCPLLSSFLRAVPDALPDDQLIAVCRAGAVSEELATTLGEYIKRDELARQAPNVTYVPRSRARQPPHADFARVASVSRTSRSFRSR